MSDAGAVTIGQRLGPYTITARLGSGGMGEVYRAHDSKLGREVAIKVLPSVFTADLDRRERFEREARVLAALNHANVGAIYGLEEVGGVPALVLELVEGPTLADRLSKGPLRPVEALSIAKEIARALEAAHERGIIHRDLKPANIKITPSGVVKVLDFGLAKAVSTDSASGSEAPTVAVNETHDGMLLGTPAYMSPEQARGQAVDKRTDIWAFGCVLYEMFTGRSAFRGATVSDTIAKILERDPDWTVLPAVTPVAVRRLLHRCLQKDSARRLRDIGDSIIDLEDSAGESEPPVPARVVRGQVPKHVGWTAGAAVVILAFFAAWIALRVGGESPIALKVARTAIVLPVGQQLSTNTGYTYALALSSDGLRIAYVAAHEGRRQLYLRELSEFEAKLVPGTSGAIQPFFAPDGRSVAFFADGELRRVSIDGGMPFRICDVKRTPIGGSWGPSGTIVFATVGAPLSKVAATGGTPDPIPDSSGALWPQILPDGGNILFTLGEGAIFSMSLNGGGTHMIARTADFPGNGPPVMGPGEVEQVRYAPTGHLVYGQGLRVMAVPFDLRSLTLRGSPVPVVDSVIRGQGGGAVSFAISQTGVLAYAPEGLHQLAWVGRDGRATVISPDRDKFRFPALSPDGKRVAVVIVSEARQSHIWIYDAESGRKTKLTEEAISPRWTPDGTRVAFCGGTTTSLTWRMADGSETQDFMFSGRQRCPTSWSSDGGTLLVNRFDDPTTKIDVWALRREAHDTSTRALLTQSFNEADAKFSPDDRWVAYVSDESGRYEVYVMSYPDLKGRTAISTDGGARPVWSRDGHELFYRQGTAIMAVGVRTGQEFQADKPRLLFDGPYVGQGGDISFDVAPDGRFLMVTGDEASLGRQLNVVTNWFEELKQRVPVQPVPDRAP